MANIEDTNISEYFDLPTEYLPTGTGYLNGGGKWFYTNNRPGTKWFDSVSNNKGWTVDFGLKTIDIQDSGNITSSDTAKGIGLYVNDGTKKEVISFLNQEIVFKNAANSFVFDTTQLCDFRLIGKENKLQLFAKENNEQAFKLLSSVDFITSSTSEGNSGKPSVVEDMYGGIHAVWHDDGNLFGQIFYSKFFDGAWSSPELISDPTNNCQYPCILIDNENTIYVAYESKSSVFSSISIVYKNELGWSGQEVICETDGSCKKPKLSFDSQYNIIATWEDYRQIWPEIYIAKLNKSLNYWGTSFKISDTKVGAINPVLATVFDDIYIAYTNLSNNISTIRVVKINPNTFAVSKTITVSLPVQTMSDNADIISTVDGKLICVWNDSSTGKSEIFGCVLNPDLDIIVATQQVSNGNGNASMAVLSTHIETNNVQIVWQDYETNGFIEFDPNDADNTYQDEAYIIGSNPYNHTLFASVFDFSSNIFVGMTTQFSNIQFTLYNRSSMSPATPRTYSSLVRPLTTAIGMPIIYELSDYNDFVSNNNKFTNIGCVFLNRSDNEYLDSFIVDPYVDFILSGQEYRKEIRFGDFSDSLNAHLLFTYFKYYTNDAVEPLQIKELDAASFNLDGLSTHDASINNYGDVWLVGTCGVYYYMYRNNHLALVGNEEEINANIDINGNITSIAFDAHNCLFIGKRNDGVFYSTEHIKCYAQLIPSIDVTSLSFDKNNTLFIGTSNGLNIGTIQENADKTISFVNTSSIIPTELSTGIFITSITTDDNNITWIGTRRGLYRYYKNKFKKFTTKDGLPSNIINDISIRNTAIRYIATSNGIAKMIGTNIDIVITTDNSGIYSNNVKSVLWQDPNILWAGTHSRISQLTVDDVEDTYISTIHEPSPSYTVQNDDLKTYYIIPPEGQEISSTTMLEVFINGNLIVDGYTIGFDTTSQQTVVKFDISLLQTDIVDVYVRKDLITKASFKQTPKEKNAIGERLIRIKDLLVADGLIYMISTGDENEVKINDTNTQLPFDKVFLDTTPPTGKVKIEKQIEKSKILVNIKGINDTDFVSDKDINGNDGSGVDTMIISNYPNFTTDGTTTQDPIPFSSSVEHDLGLTLEDVVTQLSFTEGTGCKIVYLEGDKTEIFAAENAPAENQYLNSTSKLYNFNRTTGVWDIFIEYDTDAYIDFIVKYNNFLIVSVGFETKTAGLYVYTLTYSGNTLLPASFVKYMPIKESRAFCYKEMNGVLYIGAGKGSDTLGIAPDGGQLYSYNGTELIQNINLLDTNIYSLTYVDGSNNLFAATGEAGYVYEIDIVNKTALPIHNDIEPLTNIEFIKYGDQNLIFIGGSTNGIIRRSPSNSSSFSISFRTIPSKVSSMKNITMLNGSTVLYAAIGNVLYYLNTTGVWTWKYTHSELINDFSYDKTNNIIYVISDSKINKISPLTQTKTVYLKLIDKAGNETSLQKTDLSYDQNLLDSISISDLVNFVNENKMIEIDQFGNTIFKLEGTNSYYSATKITEEKGVYEGKIFDGTNNLVKWDQIEWAATELTNTEVLLYIRSNSSANDILLAEWVGPFYNTERYGVDISDFNGRYIQFKVELISKVKNVSPSLHSVTIKSVASEAVHFFTTNFTLPSKIKKGIITSQKIVPVSADIVFGINTTNSVDWNDYQIVEENRLFNINQVGQNLRVGIKFITPTIEDHVSETFSEYGPYSSDLFINTINFAYKNNSGSSQTYHFKITLYDDYEMTNPVYTAFSYTNQEGFNINSEKLTAEGYTIEFGDTANIYFAVTNSANIQCNTYYWVKIETTTDAEDEDLFELIDIGNSFIANCHTSFSDIINYTFENNIESADFSFRIVFYEDPERTNDFLTVSSATNPDGWLVEGSAIPEGTITVNQNASVIINYQPDTTLFEPNKTYYLKIDAHYGTSWTSAIESYTYRVSEILTDEYCGSYSNVPIIKNFGIMIELDNNEFVTLNI